MRTTGIGELVDSYGGAVYTFCIHLTRDRQDAEDLYQDTFLKAVELYHKIDMTQNPRSYLLSIAVNLWKSKQRKAARRMKAAPAAGLEEAQAVSDGYELESDVISREEQLLVHQALSRLEQKFRLVLCLYYTAGLPQEEIAKILRIPQGTVKSRLYKARKLLKRELEAGNYER